MNSFAGVRIRQRAEKEAIAFLADFRNGFFSNENFPFHRFPTVILFDRRRDNKKGCRVNVLLYESNRLSYYLILL